MKRAGLRGAILFALCAFCLVSTALAQDATGRVVGTVTDPSGAVIAGAKVVVTNVETGIAHETQSAADGTFQVLALPAGKYKVSVEAKGFNTAVIGAQPLDINQALRVNAKLTIGATTQTVLVEANAATIETVNSMVSSAITGSQVVDTPLNGRNVLGLALFSPGVVPALAGGGQGFSIAGGRGDSVTYLFDGAVNNNLLSNNPVINPNPDAVEEFRVLANNYAAEYGRNGGGIVSVISKSGTNTYHGALYDYIRNNDLNASPFFNNASGLIRPILKRNQFGAAFGGPVLIPKIVHGKDRFFFFISYQGQRQASASQTSKVQVYTPAELNGDFSRSNSAGTGPDANVVKYLQTFPYFQPNAGLAAQGIIDPTKVSSVFNNYKKAGLLGSDPSGFLISQGAATDNRDELTEKIDLVITPQDHLTISLGSNRQAVLSPFGTANVPGFPNVTTTHQYFGSIGYTKSITPTILNDFRFSAQRNNGFQAVPAVTLPGPQALGIGLTPDAVTGPPIMSLASMTVGFSPQGPTNLIDNTYTWSDTLSWVKGVHTFKTGFSYTPYQDNTIYDFYVDGNFQFVAGSSGQFSKNDRADFFMGLPDNLFQAPVAPSNIRTHNVNYFLQDEWRIRRNLTLTLGVRYEYSSPKTDLQGRSFSAILGLQSTRFPNAPKGLVFPGDSGTPAGSNFPDHNDWAPRFGFAWTPRDSSKWSVRGGVGMFYDILKGEDNLQFNGQLPFFGTFGPTFTPFTKNPTSEPNYLTNPFAATGLANPFPSTPPTSKVTFAPLFGGSGVYFVDPNLRTPYIFQYNMSVQRELPSGILLEVDYIGSSSHKLTALVDINSFILGTNTRIFNGQSGVASNAFSYVPTFENVGNSNYNSLAIGVRRRHVQMGFLGQMGLNLNYTHGKSLDNVSGFRSSASQVPYYNHHAFYGPSDFDIPNYVNFSADWLLPFDKAWSSGPKRLTQGWAFYPLLTYRSGQALNVKSGISRNSTRPGPSGDGDPNIVQANVNGRVTIYDAHNLLTSSTCGGALTACGRNGNYFFDPSVFSQPAFSGNTPPTTPTYGTLGRNILRGPDQVNLDLRISKRTRITERMEMELIADYFNSLNHTEFSNPSTSITSSLFGQISNTNSPRIIQIAARFTW